MGVTNKNLLLTKANYLLRIKKLLVHYDLGKPLILSCIASPYGLTAVLSHQIQYGSEKPATCASSFLSRAEKNYSQIDQKSLAVSYALKKFR